MNKISNTHTLFWKFKKPLFWRNIGRLVFFLFVLTSFQIQAQRKPSTIKGIGVFGAMTSSAHYYDNTSTHIQPNAPFVNSHISKELLSWGAGVFVEISRRERLRWQTELEYCNKGAQEKELLNAFTGERSGTWQKNKYSYIQWNNYLKYYSPIGYNAHWYALLGLRIEYLLRKSTPVFSTVSSNFPKFWFSGDIGLGYEIPVYKRFSAFMEFHWNPDIISHNHIDTQVRNRTLELRVGAVMRPRKRRVDDCNTPRYNGPDY